MNNLPRIAAFLFRFRFNFTLMFAGLASLALLLFASLPAYSAQSAEDRDDVAGVLTVGDLYGGGIVAYILQPGDPGYVPGQLHGRVISTEDVGKEIVWSSMPDQATGTCAALNAGKTNSRKIIGQSGRGPCAASLCLSYNTTVDCSTYDDWYLPSKEELEKVCQNRASLVKFASGLYWSSSEQNAGQAWGVNLNSGVSLAVEKSARASVRAMRSF